MASVQQPGRRQAVIIRPPDDLKRQLDEYGDRVGITTNAAAIILLRAGLAAEAARACLPAP